MGPSQRVNANRCCLADTQVDFFQRFLGRPSTFLRFGAHRVTIRTVSSVELEAEGTMEAETSSQVLIDQLRAGDCRAADAIFHRFAQRLVGMARNRLDGRVRQKVDAEDVVQSVFRSFFDRSARGEFDFANWEGVWGLLVLLTVRKCGRRATGDPLSGRLS